MQLPLEQIFEDSTVLKSLIHASYFVVNMNFTFSQDEASVQGTFLDFRNI